MRTIKKKTRIDASLDKVYHALTEADGYRGWWCKNSAIADWEGGESLLHFLKDGTPVSMRFRVDSLEPAATVHWTCVANDAPPWVGTTLSWALSGQDGDVSVELEHGGWKHDPPEGIEEGWDHFVGSLRSFVENGAGQPW